MPLFLLVVLLSTFENRAGIYNLPYEPRGRNYVRSRLDHPDIAHCHSAHRHLDCAAHTSRQVHPSDRQDLDVTRDNSKTSLASSIWFGKRCVSCKGTLATGVAYSSTVNRR